MLTGRIARHEKVGPEFVPFLATDEQAKLSLAKQDPKTYDALLKSYDVAVLTGTARYSAELVWADTALILTDKKASETQRKHARKVRAGLEKLTRFSRVWFGLKVALFAFVALFFAWSVLKEVQANFAANAASAGHRL
jgi:hypothetical protein